MSPVLLVFRRVPLIVLLVLGVVVLSPAPARSVLQRANDMPQATLGAGNDSNARPFKMSHTDFRLEWGVVASQEQDCSGRRVAGGAIRGTGNFTHLGQSRIEMSAAWDIDNLLDPSDVQFTPVGPAGGPVAPVLRQPYRFQFNPFTRQCGDAVTATGDVVLTAANGDKVFGLVTGGETHRLDFLIPGDGIETFAIINVVGGTGRFEGATGSFVAHTITRVYLVRTNIELAEVLPGGWIRY